MNKERVDKENIDVEAQKELIKVAKTDLLQAQALKTKASKDKELVVQKKITMNAQLEKIDYLKADMKKHLKKGDQAAKRARDSLHKVKNMEKDAIQSKKEAVAQEAYAKNIDIPIALTALKNANIAVETEKQYENDERDEIKRLEQERAAEHARIKSIHTAAALQVPGVLAVLTSDDLRPLGLHWMPTLAGDKQWYVRTNLSDPCAQCMSQCTRPAGKGSVVAVSQGPACVWD